MNESEFCVILTSNGVVFCKLIDTRMISNPFYLKFHEENEIIIKTNYDPIPTILKIQTNKTVYRINLQKRKVRIVNYQHLNNVNNGWYLYSYNLKSLNSYIERIYLKIPLIVSILTNQEFKWGMNYIIDKLFEIQAENRNKISKQIKHTFPKSSFNHEKEKLTISQNTVQRYNSNDSKKLNHCLHYVKNDKF